MAFFLQAHSGWRWVVLALIVIVIIKTLIGWIGNQEWNRLDSRLILYSRIALYVQVVLGLIVYILAQKWAEGFAFIGSHIIPGLLAVGGVEFGAVRSKKVTGRNKYMFAFIGFVIALILIYGALATVGGLFA